MTKVKYRPFSRYSFYIRTARWKINCLLDNESEKNLITRDFVQHMQLPTTPHSNNYFKRAYMLMYLLLKPLQDK